MKVQHKTQKREISKSCRNILIPTIALKQKRWQKSTFQKITEKCTGSFSVFVVPDRPTMNELSVDRQRQWPVPVSAWGWPR